MVTKREASLALEDIEGVTATIITNSTVNKCKAAIWAMEEAEATFRTMISTGMAER